MTKKNGFPMPSAKKGIHIPNLHPKKYILKKKNFFNANLLENSFIHYDSYI